MHPKLPMPATDPDHLLTPIYNWHYYQLFLKILNPLGNFFLVRKNILELDDQGHIYIIHLICTNFHRKERFLLHEDKPGKWSYKLARCRRQSNQKDTRRGLLRVFDYRLPSHEIYLKEERERKYTQKKKKKSSQNYHFFFMCPNSFRLFISTSRCKCLW